MTAGKKGFENDHPGGENLQFCTQPMNERQLRTVSQLTQLVSVNFDNLMRSQSVKKNKFSSLCMGKKISSHENHITEDHGNWIPQHDSILNLFFQIHKNLYFINFLKNLDF